MNAPHSVSDDGVDCVYIEAGHLSVCTTVRLQNYTESGGHQTAVLCQRHVHGQEGQLLPETCPEKKMFRVVIPDENMLRQTPTPASNSFA